MKRINKRFMKKLYSVCIAFAMVLSVAGGPTVTVYASQLGDNTIIEGTEPIEITSVDVTVTIPKSGEINPTPVVSANGVGYTAEVAVRDGYAGWNNAGGQPMGADEVMISGNDIKLLINIIPESGYTLTPSTTVSVNGSSDNVLCIGGYENPASEIEFTCRAQLDGIIDVIELSDVPTPVVGEPVAAYSYTGTNYSVTGSWLLYDSETKSYNPVDTTHIFANGNTYKLQLVAKSSVGYEFADGIQVNANIDYDKYMSSFNEVQLGFITSFGTVIEEVSISEDSIPKAEVGKTFEDKMIEIPVPEGSNYKVVGYWTDEDGNTSGTFENGKVYQFNMEVYPNSGYYLSEDLILYIGEEPYPIGLNHDVALYIHRQSFATLIDKVYVSNLPEAVVGETIKKGENGVGFDVEVPADANYIVCAWWESSDGLDMAEDTFQSGKSYSLCVSFEPKEGYEFSDSLVVNADGIDYGDYGGSENWVLFTKTYSFRKVIDKIQVDGFKKPVVGEKATVDSLKVPDGANYQIASAWWIDYNTWELAVTFENGHEYYLDLCLEPKEGYEFSEYADVIVDGEDLSDMGHVASNEAYLSFGHTSFETLVSEIRVDNVPEMKVGEKATVEATVPAGANYGIDNMKWLVWDDKSNSYKEFTGTFETGKFYELAIFVLPQEGYRFDKDATVIYINGVLEEDLTAYEDIFVISKEYSNDLKVIDRVEFTVAEPVVGNHASILPQVMVSSDANYYAADDYSTNWLYEKNGTYKPFYGYFDESTSYGVSFYSVADDGYVFAEDLVVVVNGVVVSKDNIEKYGKEIYIDYFFGAECEHIYGDWSDAKDGTHTKTCTICGHKVTEEHIYTDASGTKCSVCAAEKKAENPTTGGAPAGDNTDSKPGATDPGSPATGDTWAMAYMITMMAMCGIAIYALERRKKKI